MINEIAESKGSIKEQIDYMEKSILELSEQVEELSRRLVPVLKDDRVSKAEELDTKVQVMSPLAAQVDTYVSKLGQVKMSITDILNQLDL